MALNEHTTGSSVFVTASFTDPRDDDAPVDPSTVTLAVKAPGSVDYADVEPNDITKVSTGEYEYILLLSEEGTYRWKWTGTLGQKVVVIPGFCNSVFRD